MNRTSKYKNVVYCPRYTLPWHGKITLDKVRYYTPRCRTELEAVKELDRIRRKLKLPTQFKRRRK
jgi:hypothetical protein